MKLKFIGYFILGILTAFLLIETVNIFTIECLTTATLLLFISYLILTQLISSIQKTNNTITLNNNVWPKYLYILISIIIGLTLFYTLDENKISYWENILAISLIFILIIFPSIIILGRTVKNRNDFIVIDETHIQINDNEVLEKILIEDIAVVQNKKNIEIDLHSGNSFVINKKTLNLNFIDQRKLYKIIKKIVNSKNNL